MRSFGTSNEKRINRKICFLRHAHVSFRQIGNANMKTRKNSTEKCLSRFEHQLKRGSSIFAIIIYVICKLSTFTISLFSLKGVWAGKRCRGSTCFFFRFNCFTSNAICFFISISQFLKFISGTCWYGLEWAIALSLALFFRHQSVEKLFWAFSNPALNANCLWNLKFVLNFYLKEKPNETK